MATSSWDVRPVGQSFWIQAAAIGKSKNRRMVLTLALGVGLGLGACTAAVNDPPGGVPGTGGSGAANASGGSGVGQGGVGPGLGGAGAPQGTAGSGVNPGSAGAGVVTGLGGSAVPAGTGGAAVVCNPGTVAPGRAPLRRITKFEYGNTVRDLFGDTTSPETALPAETLTSGTAIFGNNADAQSVPNILAQNYETVAEGIAQRATATPAALGKLATCGSTITATAVTATEDACAKSIIAALVPRAYRRSITTAESDELVALYKLVRPANTFASGIAAVIEGVLQSPDFLYRVEFGVADTAKPSLKRPTGPEMATRLSYLFWGTMPDAPLTAMAASGALLTNAGVMTQAKQMLDDPRSHPIIAYFFDSLLPINTLTSLERDKTLYPTFNPTIGSLMHQETQRFLEYEIYEGPGTWPDILTAPYTFVNDALATYYGISGVTGSTFQKVATDPKKRIGLLSQGGFLAGSTISNNTNPVARGSFIVQKLMCRIIPLPTGAILAMVKPPEPYSANTGRERYALHRSQPVCMTCHQFMDPVGLTLENYDPVGLWRDTENGEMIDPSGTVPGADGTATGPTVAGPIEMMKALAGADATQTCFATHWLEYGYGRSMDPADACTQQSVQTAFKGAGYNVKQLLLSLTQTDAFLYLPAQ